MKPKTIKAGDTPIAAVYPRKRGDDVTYLHESVLDALTEKQREQVEVRAGNKPYTGRWVGTPAELKRALERIKKIRK